MIKRVLGIIFTLLVIATIIFAALKWGTYSSMVFNFGTEQQEEVAEEIADDEFIDGEEMINGVVDGEEMIDGQEMIDGGGDNEAI